MKYDLARLTCSLLILHIEMQFCKRDVFTVLVSVSINYITVSPIKVQLGKKDLVVRIELVSIMDV